MLIHSAEDLIPIGIFIAAVVRFFLLINLLRSIQEKRSRAGLDILKSKTGFSNVPAHLSKTFSSFFDETPEQIKYSLHYSAPSFELALIRIVTGHGKSRGIRQYLFLQSRSNSLADFAWVKELRESDVPAISAARREAASRLLSGSGTQLRSLNRWLILRGDLDTSMPQDSRLSELSRASRYASVVLAILGVGQELLEIKLEPPFLEALKQLQSESESIPKKQSKSRYLLLVPVGLFLVVSLLVLNVYVTGALKRLMAYSTQNKTHEWSVGVASIVTIWFAGVAMNSAYKRSSS